MNGRPIVFLAGLALFFGGFGCGKAPESSVKEALAVQLTFPQALAPGTKRYRKFLTRVRFLELVLTAEGGETKHLSYPPTTWSSLPRVAAPPGGSLTVLARIWDHGPDGQPRTFPVLTTPSRKVGASELRRGDPVPVHLRFSLHVDPKEWE